MTAGIEARIKAQEEKLKQLKAQKQQGPRLTMVSGVIS